MCSHNKTNQKGCQMGPKNSQDWKICLCFTIQNHGNHGKLFLSHSYECQRIQTKIHLIKF
jgi:hypothetical protein